MLSSRCVTSPLKSADLRNALRSIWEVFAEFYTWVDPEESEEDEDDEDEVEGEE